MIDLTLRAEVDDIETKLGELSYKANIVMVRATNRAVSNVKTNIKKEVSSKYIINQSEVAKTLKVKKASYSNPTAIVKSIDVHPNLAKFKVSPFRHVKINKDGSRNPNAYSAAVFKNGGMGELSETPKPFIATMSNGFTGVFRRKSNSDKTLKGVYGPAVPQMLKVSTNAIKHIEDEAFRVINERINHEIGRILKKGK